MEGISVRSANMALAALTGRVYVKLHVGAPGPAGLKNPAVEVTRQQVTFGDPLNGQVVSTTDARWEQIAGEEKPTRFSAWDAPTGGNFLFSGTVNSNGYSNGDMYTIGAGKLTVALPVAN